MKAALAASSKSGGSFRFRNAEIPDGSEVEKFRSTVQKLKGKSISSVKDFEKLFRRCDNHGSGSLTRGEFKVLVGFLEKRPEGDSGDWAVEKLSDQEIERLYETVNINKTGIKFYPLLQVVRGPLPFQRTKLVEFAFNRLDIGQRGLVEPSDVKKFVRSNVFSEVLQGEKKELDVVKDIMKTLDFSGSGKISKTDFEDYYLSQSFFMESDKKFQDLIFDYWRFSATDIANFEKWSQTADNQMILQLAETTRRGGSCVEESEDGGKRDSTRQPSSAHSGSGEHADSKRKAVIGELFESDVGSGDEGSLGRGQQLKRAQTSTGAMMSKGSMIAKRKTLTSTSSTTAGTQQFEDAATGTCVSGTSVTGTSVSVSGTAEQQQNGILPAVAGKTIVKTISSDRVSSMQQVLGEHTTVDTGSGSTTTTVFPPAYRSISPASELSRAAGIVGGSDEASAFLGSSVEGKGASSAQQQQQQAESSTPGGVGNSSSSSKGVKRRSLAASVNPGGQQTQSATSTAAGASTPKPIVSATSMNGLSSMVVSDADSAANSASNALLLRRIVSAGGERETGGGLDEVRFLDSMEGNELSVADLKNGSSALTDRPVMPRSPKSSEKSRSFNSETGSQLSNSSPASRHDRVRNAAARSSSISTRSDDEDVMAQRTTVIANHDFGGGAQAIVIIPKSALRNVDSLISALPSENSSAVITMKNDNLALSQEVAELKARLKEHQLQLESISAENKKLRSSNLELKQQQQQQQQQQEIKSNTSTGNVGSSGNKDNEREAAVASKEQVVTAQAQTILTQQVTIAAQTKTIKSQEVTIGLLQQLMATKTGTKLVP